MTIIKGEGGGGGEKVPNIRFLSIFFQMKVQLMSRLCAKYKEN